MSLPKTDVAIYIALREEFDRLKASFPYALIPQPNWAGESSALTQQFEVYTFSFADDSGINRNGLVLLGGDTDDEGMPALGALVGRFDIDILITIGISGVLAKEVNAGDIVVARSIDDYSHRSKAVESSTGEDYKLALGGRAIPVDESLARAFHRLIKDRNNLHTRMVFRNATETYDRFLANLSDQDRRRLSEIASIGPKGVGIEAHYGPFASGFLVSKAEGFKTALLSRNPNAIAVDMESGLVGHYVKTASPQTRYFSIRGISDPGNKSKSEFEQITRGLFRTTTIDCISELVAIFLRVTIGIFQTNHDVTPAFADPIQSLTAFSDEQIAKNSYPATELQSSADIGPKLDALFSQLVAEPLPFGLSLVTHLASELDATGAKLIVSGESGAGKTSLLIAINNLLKRYDNTIAVYINLRHGDTATVGASIADLERVLQRLIMLAAPNRGARRLALLVDGYAVNSELDRDLETLIRVLEREWPTHSLLLALSDTGDSPHAGTVVGDREWTASIKLAPLSVVNEGGGSSTDKVLSFVTAFLQVTAADVAKNFSPSFLCERIRHLGFLRIDVFILSTIISNINRNAYSRSRHYPKFFENVIQQMIQDATAGDTLTALAERAFKLRFPVAGISTSKGDLPSIIFRHRDLFDVLIARHVIDTILISRERLRASGAGIELTDSEKHVFRQVHDHKVNHIIKYMIQEGDIESKVVDGCRIIVETDDFETMNLATYILGRASTKLLKARAQKILKDALSRFKIGNLGIFQKNDQNEMDLTVRRLRLCARSIYISICYLGDHDIIHEYVELLLTDRLENDLNRGFHLAYYGDISPKAGADYVPSDKDYVPTDKGEDWTKTRKELRERIRQVIRENSRNPIINIDIATFASLAQHRLAGGIENNERLEARELIQNVLSADVIIKSSLRSYLGMIEARLARPRFSPFDFIAELARLKFEPRRGWLSNGVGQTRPVETVSAHILSAVLIAWFLLPEGECDGERYDKQKIIDILLTHDLGEAYTGDFLPGELNQEEEEHAYQLIMFLDTFDGIERTRRSFESWRRFDRKESIEDQIAFDIDKIEAAFQAKLYRESFSTESGYKSFVDKHRNYLGTRTGTWLWQFLERY